MSLSLLLFHLCSPLLQQEPAVSTPFRLDLPEQEPPHPTLGPCLSHSSVPFPLPPPPPKHWGPGARLGEEGNHKHLVPSTVQALSFRVRRKVGKWGRQGKTFAQNILTS